MYSSVPVDFFPDKSGVLGLMTSWVEPCSDSVVASKKWY